MATKADPLQLGGSLNSQFRHAVVLVYFRPPVGGCRGHLKSKWFEKCLGRRQQGDATQSERGFDKAAKPSTLFVIVPLL